MSDLRNSREVAILGVLESTYGVENTTFAATDALFLTEEPTYDTEWLNVDRNNITPYFGVSEQLQGLALVKATYKTELVSSGAAGTPPRLGPWLIACGMTETIYAGNRVEYTQTPYGTLPGSMSHRFNNAGVRYISKGARGRFKLDLSIMKAPSIEFNFWSLARVESVQAMPSLDYTGFKIPEVVTDAASGDIRFGTVLAAGNVTGGTAYKSKGIMIDYANDLQHYPMLGGEDISIADRKVTGKMTVALSEAQEMQWYTDQRALTTSTLSFVHGSAAGKKIVVHGRNVQRYNSKRAPDRGRLQFDVDLGYIPVGADNELTLIFK